MVYGTIVRCYKEMERLRKIYGRRYLSFPIDDFEPYVFYYISSNNFDYRGWDYIEEDGTRGCLDTSSYYKLKQLNYNKLRKGI